MNITAQAISKGSVFKIYFIGLTVGFFILFMSFGIAAIFGANTVIWDDEPVTGSKGFVTAMLIWPFFSLIFTVLMWLVSILGLWLYSLVRPITINFTNASPIDDKNA